MPEHTGATDERAKLVADAAWEAGVLGIIEEKDVDVPMRDGVVLRANVFRPDSQGEFPAILLRTPYRKPVGGYERYVRAGYAVVTQDSRGRYASDGDYIPFTEEHTGDAEDGYDSVEWVAGQSWCTGKVGLYGPSYVGATQWLAAASRRPVSFSATPRLVCNLKSSGRRDTALR